jgi:hypothetical protein
LEGIEKMDLNEQKKWEDEETKAHLLYLDKSGDLRRLMARNEAFRTD